MNQISKLYPEDKNEMYELVYKQLVALLEGERDLVANLANTSALLNGAMQEVLWLGFYLSKGDSLVLGPFQGEPACFRISVGRGVCGAAAAKQSLIVADVHTFPGHIACSSESNSEIVVPIIDGDLVLGVLDIDSTVFSRFDAIDRIHLERIASLLVTSCDWNL